MFYLFINRIKSYMHIKYEIIIFSLVNCNNNNYNYMKHIYFHSIHISGAIFAMNSYYFEGNLI